MIFDHLSPGNDPVSFLQEILSDPDLHAMHGVAQNALDGGSALPLVDAMIAQMTEMTEPAFLEAMSITEDGRMAAVVVMAVAPKLIETTKASATAIAAYIEQEVAAR